MELEEIEKLVKDLNKIRKSANKVLPRLDDFVKEAETARKTLPNELSTFAKKMKILNVEFVFQMLVFNLKTFVQLLDNNTNELKETLLKK